METLFALAASPQCGIVVLLSKKKTSRTERVARRNE